MSIQRVQAVLEKSRMKGAARLCLLAIADRAKEDGFAWPGIEDIARRAGISRRSAFLQLKKAVAAGELYVHNRPGSSNQYIVLVGQTEERIYIALHDHFGLSTVEIGEWLATRDVKNFRGEDSARVNGDSLGGEGNGTPGGESGFTGGVNQDSPESLINPQLNNPHLTLNEEASHLSPKGEAEILWQRCCQMIDMDREYPPRFKRLLERTRAVIKEEERLVIEAPGAYERDWLQARAAQTLENLLRGMVKGEMRVEFVVGGEEPQLTTDGRG